MARPPAILDPKHNRRYRNGRAHLLVTKFNGSCRHCQGSFEIAEDMRIARIFEDNQSVQVYLHVRCWDPWCIARSNAQQQAAMRQWNNP